MSHFSKKRVVGDAMNKQQSLEWRDRLGLAWCRLNSGEWDDLLGAKPVTFDNYGWKEKGKEITQLMKKIEQILSEAEISRYWWVYKLHRTDESWLSWYLFKDRKAQ